MEAYFTAKKLAVRIGSLELPCRDVAGQLRQDANDVGVPSRLILEKTQLLGAQTTDSVSAMVLRLLAFMLDRQFQAICEEVTTKYNGTFKATAPKGHTRMMNKASMPGRR